VTVLINIDVPDAEIGVRFYVAAFGLKIGRRFGGDFLDIVVDDVDAVVARAVAADATLEAPTRDTPYGRIAMLGDPFGHGFCPLQFSAQGYDALLDEGS